MYQGCGMHIGQTIVKKAIANMLRAEIDASVSKALRTIANNFQVAPADH